MRFIVFFVWNVLRWLLRASSYRFFVHEQSN